MKSNRLHYNTTDLVNTNIFHRNNKRKYRSTAKRPGSQSQKSLFKIISCTKTAWNSIFSRNARLLSLGQRKFPPSSLLTTTVLRHPMRCSQWMVKTAFKPSTSCSWQTYSLVHGKSTVSWTTNIELHAWQTYNSMQLRPIFCHAHFSNSPTDAPYHELLLLFHIISHLPGNSVKCMRNIWQSSK